MESHGCGNLSTSPVASNLPESFSCEVAVFENFRDDRSVFFANLSDLCERVLACGLDVDMVSVGRVFRFLGEVVAFYMRK